MKKTDILLWSVFCIFLLAGSANSFFSPNIMVNDPSTAAQDAPRIAYHSDTLYVVWFDDREGLGDIMFSRSADGGSTWLTNPVKVNSEEGIQWFPDIAVDENGNITVVWSNFILLDIMDVYFSRSTDGGNTWSPQQMINTHYQYHYDPSVAVLGDTICVAWSDTRFYWEDIYFRMSIDGGQTWFSERQVDDGTGGVKYRPSIGIDTQGQIYVAWHDSRSGDYDIYFATSTDGGQTWTNPNILINDPSFYVQSGASLDVLSPGNIVLTWQDERKGPDLLDIYFAKSTDGGMTWTHPNVPVDTLATSSHAPRIAAYTGDKIGIVWEDHLGCGIADVYFAYTKDGGVTWEERVRVDDSSAGEQWRAALTVDGFGYYCAVWQDDRMGDEDIYFSKGKPPVGIVLLKEFVGNSKDKFGCSVASPDVNRDHYQDLVIGAKDSDLPVEGRGMAYLYYGSLAGDSLPDLTFYEAGIEGFGRSVASIGHYTPDAYDDIVIGTESGYAFVYFGGSPMDNIPDQVLTGTEVDELFGWSVAGAGDVDRDGYDDLIIGSPNGGQETGLAYIFFGPRGERRPLILEGEQQGDLFGYSVFSAGDVNGDQYSDVIVGAPGSINYGGKAYIYYGGSQMDPHPDVVLKGENYEALGTSVASAGDVNSDDFDDVLVGAPGDTSLVIPGMAYVFYGDRYMDDFPDVALTAGVAGDGFGTSVSTLGDLNVDGFEDVIVGAPLTQNETGRVFIYFGAENMDSIADHTIDGELAYDHFGSSCAPVGYFMEPPSLLIQFVVGAPRPWPEHPPAGKAYLFRLEGLGSGQEGGPLAFGDPGALDITPKENGLNLLQNYPNPATFGTNIQYSLPERSKVVLNIYNVTGQLIRTLIDSEQGPGTYRVYWDVRAKDGNKVPDGVYFYRIEAGRFTASQKATVLR